MDRAETEKILLEGVREKSNDEGWANLAQIGAFLRQQNIRYGKLIKFLESYQNILELRQDETVTPPAVYVKLKLTEDSDQSE